jgi:F-type H+-transporting ATPase subunit delta
MKKQILAQRYGHGLTNALTDEAEFETVLQELKDMAGLFLAPGEVRDFLESPFVISARKSQAVKDILTRASLSAKTVRFLLLLQDNDRLSILPDVIDVLPSIWDERRGIISFEVASVVPLTEAQKVRLGKKLEALEGRPVSLTFVLDPDLVGGLTVTKGHRIYDVSMKGQVEALREIITEG